MIDELFSIKLALDNELEELYTYKALINDPLTIARLEGQIAGIKRAQNYLVRRLAATIKLNERQSRSTNLNDEN